MQIQDMITVNSKKIRVELDNGVSFVLYKGECARLALNCGDELSEEQWDEICGQILTRRAKKRGMYLLQRMDRTEKQLKDALSANGYPQEAVDAAVDYVKSFHYIDDGRYARNYIRSRQESRSRSRIRMDLLSKGVSSAVIDEAMEEEYTADQRMLIGKLLKKKGYDPSEADPAMKQKIMRFLLSRGFGWEDIRSCMNGFENGLEDMW